MSYSQYSARAWKRPPATLARCLAGAEFSVIGNQRNDGIGAEESVTAGRFMVLNAVNGTRHDERQMRVLDSE
jgi:hypothetical protein